MTAIIPGLVFTRPEPRDVRVLEVKHCKKLGRALGRDWFTHRDFAEQEIRVDAEVPGFVLADNPPADRIYLHHRRHQREWTEEIPTTEYGPTKKKVHPAETVELYHRCTLVPIGSFAEAQAVDARHAAIAAKRSDPERLVAQRARIQRAKQRQRWFTATIDPSLWSGASPRSGRASGPGSAPSLGRAVPGEQCRA
jgi:hypothetical protein